MCYASLSQYSWVISNVRTGAVYNSTLHTVLSSDINSQQPGTLSLFHCCKGKAGGKVLTVQMEKEMVTHSSIVAWKIPWTVEPGGLYSPWGHKRVRHDLVTKQHRPNAAS